jgi:uroporphyrin-III C-methyltransferase
MERSAKAPQTVYLVGAGPGDPELITLKAERLLREAEAVIYDRLVAPEILDMIPPGAMRVYVGKASRHHPIPQNEINDLLVALARSGRRVVRLKGGDPFIFGRGCEEMHYLASHGIPCEVVPGVTAAAGVAASLGLPLTHRQLASGVRFVTGHRCADAPLELDWAGLADPDTTLVIYMGLASLPEFASRLIEAGLPATTPAAAVASATTGRQRVCCAPLIDLPERAVAAALEAPVLILVGRVVALAKVWDATAEQEALEDDVAARRERAHLA